MRRVNSIIEIPMVYQTPEVVEMFFDFEGPLCSSEWGEEDGVGGGSFEPDPEMPGVDF
ncbi:MAG: hypothetical protein IKW11_09415 [Bacteroidales bacterium]|nr:hypothetical protein [Bacteroidales bacterium]